MPRWRADADDPCGPHQPDNPLLADCPTLGMHLGMNSRGTIGAVRDSMDRAHSSEQHRRWRVLKGTPGIVAGGRHAKHACRGSDGGEGLVRSHELHTRMGSLRSPVRTMRLPLPRYRAPGAVAGSHDAYGSAPHARRWSRRPVGGLHRDRPVAPIADRVSGRFELARQFSGLCPDPTRSTICRRNSGA